MRGVAMQFLLLTWALLPGCGAVSGPRTVRGVLGGTLSVTCTYWTGDKMKPKFWCTPGTFNTCAEDIIVTTEENPVKRSGRFSIQDHRAHRAFTVTVEDLAMEDAGIHRCGVRTGLLGWDQSADVRVIVFPAPSSSSPMSPYASTTRHPSLSNSVSAPKWTTTQGKAVEQDSDLTPNKGSNPEGSNPALLGMAEYILVPGIVAVLLLLAVAAGVLVMLSRKRKKALSGAAVEMDGIYNTSHTRVDTLTYMDINHRAGTAESQLYSNAEAFRHLANTTTEYAEVKNNSKCLEEEKEATYASVGNSLLEQQEIYANVPSALQPREELYSKVQRA